jgi:putative hydrolase of HD superfamily
MHKIEKIQKQIEFIAEIDKLKGVLRQTSPIGMERRENSAEHSWQVVLCAIVFSEYANEKIDLLKVVKMLALHDIVEVDVGDTFHYHKTNIKDLHQQELAAAERIFGLLEKPQFEEYLSLWKEFEERKTPEATFSAAIDRIIPMIINSKSNGGNWIRNNITLELALEKNSHIQDGSKVLWEMAQKILRESDASGYMHNSG